MIRRHALTLGLAAACATALPSMGAAQSAGDILAAVSQRLAQIRTLEADFVQRNSDGSSSTGKMSVQRPGKMRMEYTGPNAPLVIVGSDQIAIYDGPRDKTPEVYPLRKTPLWLVLRPDVNLTRGKGVRRAWAQGGRYYVHTTDPNMPEAGEITFQFGGSPLMLQGWESKSNSGERVTVALTHIRIGGSFRSSIFSPTTENNRRSDR